MNKHIFKIVIIAVVVVLIGVGFWLIQQQDSGFVSSKIYFFGGPKNISMLPIIAEKRGYFGKNGLNMERKDILTGGLTYDALVNKEIDFGVIVDTNIALANIKENPDLEIIAIIQEKFDDVIIADSSIQKPKDLEGKRIAITPLTTSHAFAAFYLTLNGVDISSVEFVNMTPPAIQEALIQGEIEAGSLWQPFRYNVINELGDQVKTFNDRGAYTGFALVAVRAGFPDENPKVVENFLRALIDAKEYVGGSLLESQKILAEEVEIPFKILTDVWDEYSIKVSLSQSLIVTLENEAIWAIKNNLTDATEVPNYLDYIYFDALEAVSPEAVTIVR
jgi:ABC-type nitrate/sulfonate/bicarbonate transport system substrate-binding protein